MKLLFDQNLAPVLAAKLNKFAIVTKDADYNNLSVVRGHPPKVVWLLTGNCTTNQIESILRARSTEILAFDTNPALGTFAVS